MYQPYVNYINSGINDISKFDFKSNHIYRSILEHVSKEHGDKYLNLISSMFNEITNNDIKKFAIMNDSYGKPIKKLFILSDNSVMECSPTSLRYIFHALIILSYYKKNNMSNNIVEIGGGYGGLFLAINFFSEILNIKINKYYIIDLPEICSLINKYIGMHQTSIQYQICLAENYGSDIDDDKLFLISNYCFTEISNENREKYIKDLFPKIHNGFIIWQTIFGLPISSINIINKSIHKVEHELPQTASQNNPNFFVYF